MTQNHPQIRSNIFQRGLSRRPASTAPPNANANNINMNIPGPNGIGLSHGHSNGHGLSRPSHRLKPTGTNPDTSIRGIKISENREIVARDKNGGYKLDVPALSGLIGEDGEELGDIVEQEDGDVGFDEGGIVVRDKEKFNAALVEMMIRHRNRQSSGEPDEILDLVQQSLRKKVASLDDDSWMFEPEKDMGY